MLNATWWSGLKQKNISGKTCEIETKSTISGTLSMFELVTLCHCDIISKRTLKWMRFILVLGWYFSLCLAGSIVFMPVVKQKQYRRTLGRKDARIVVSMTQVDKKMEED